MLKNKDLKQQIYFKITDSFLTTYFKPINSLLSVFIFHCFRFFAMIMLLIL